MSEHADRLPVQKRWENQNIFQRIAGGFSALLGLTRGGRNFPVFPDDVFLVSYPRSGNTWTRFLIANLIYQDKPVTFADIEYKIPDTTVLNRRELARVPRPRIIKSHEYFDPRYKKVIYIVRDPRDVAVSNYYLQLWERFITEEFPIDLYIKKFVAGEINLHASWGENVSSWLATRSESKDFLLLRYEDMIADPSRELIKVAHFLGTSATPERIGRAVELSSAERMRNLEKAEASKWKAMGGKRRDVPFVRNAKSGGWKSSLSPESVALIESEWGRLMGQLGYELSTQAY